MRNPPLGPQARGQILVGIRRLAAKYPYHAKVLERFDLCVRPGVATMGVTIAGDDVRLLYNPAFVLTLSPAQLIGVLLHEVHHVVLGHLVATETAYPDHWARTVAEEVSVNEFIKEPLPPGAILLDQFPGLPSMESTDQRYHRLKSVKNRFPLSTPTALGGVSGRASSRGSGQKGVIVDDHSVWQDAQQDRERAEGAMRAILQDAGFDVGSEKIPDDLRDALLAMGIGHAPGDGKYDLEGRSRGNLNWIQLLRRYVGRELTVEPDFTYPSRRLPALVGVVPGRRHRGGRPQIMAVIDTSASITPQLLELISGELGRLADEYRVTVVECDAQIQRVYPYRPIRSVRGRGGTDLQPPFSRDFIGAHRPDLVVYFTDGYGPAPGKTPPVPVIWCLTPEGEQPCTWGRVIRMSPAETHRNENEFVEA